MSHAEKSVSQKATGVQDELRVCPKCNCAFPATQEYFYRRSATSLFRSCKKCYNLRGNEYKAANSDKLRSYKRDIRKARKQDRRCLTCGKPCDNHTTKCSKCCTDIMLYKTPYRVYATPCVICGFEYSDVHHIDGDHTNNDPANLISLCPNHHRLVHRGFLSLLPATTDSEADDAR